MKESPNTLVKMKKGPGRPKKSEAIIKDVKRRTKRLFNPEEKRRLQRRLQPKTALSLYPSIPNASRNGGLFLMFNIADLIRNLHF